MSVVKELEEERQARFWEEMLERQTKGWHGEKAYFVHLLKSRGGETDRTASPGSWALGIPSLNNFGRLVPSRANLTFGAIREMDASGFRCSDTNR